MTPEQLRLVGSTVARIEEQADQFAGEFFTALVSIAPSMQAFLPADSSELAALGSTFVRELAYLATAAGDLPMFVHRARRRGAHFQRRGVCPDDFAVAEQALVAALADTLGDNFTAETERAWRRLYRLIAETMLEGGACAQFERLR